MTHQGELADDEIASIRANLLSWYQQHARDLPWRRTRDPYRIWVSEVMLQQTRVETVVPYYQRWLEVFPDVAALAAADEDTVLKQWEGLGYYRRARFLHRAAQVVVSERDGELPVEADDWGQLPGVGRYTAGAIASIAHGKRAAVVDGNVKRVFSRLLAIRESIDHRGTEKALWRFAELLVPASEPGDFNQALMELGARLCVPRRPRCLLCPVERQCAARAAGIEKELPVRSPKKAVPHADVVAALIVDDEGRWLLGKRPAKGLLAGLWEFPGGKVESGETAPEALARELDEELGITTEIGARLAVADHAYTHLRVRLHLYEARIVDGEPTAKVHSALRWITPDEIGEYPLPAATHKLLAQLD